MVWAGDCFEIVGLKLKYLAHFGFICMQGTRFSAGVNEYNCGHLLPEKTLAYDILKFSHCCNNINAALPVLVIM